MRGSSQRVMKPLWKFAQHGQSRPLGVGPLPRDQPARRRPLLHPLDAHRGGGARPGDAVPALRLDQRHPAVDGLVGARTGWAPRTPTCPASSRSRRRPATAGRATTATRSCPRSIRGRPLGKAGSPAVEATIRNLANPIRSPDAQRRQFDLLRALNAEQLKQTPGRLASSRRSSRRTSWPGGCRANAPDVLDLSRETRGNAGALRHRRPARPTTSAGSA